MNFSLSDNSYTGSLLRTVGVEFGRLCLSLQAGPKFDVAGLSSGTEGQDPLYRSSLLNGCAVRFREDFNLR